MGEIETRWEKARMNLPRFLGAICDDNYLMNSPFYCHILTCEIQHILEVLRRKNMWDDLERGDNVIVFDGMTYLRGKVVKLVADENHKGELTKFPIVEVEGVEVRIDNLRYCLADLRGKQFKQLELFADRSID